MPRFNTKAVCSDLLDASDILDDLKNHLTLIDFLLNSSDSDLNEKTITVLSLYREGTNDFLNALESKLKSQEQNLKEVWD